MRELDAELASHGATLAFVGTGSPAMAAEFARLHAGPHPVLGDPERQVFAAAGMRRSLWASLHWRLLGNAWRAWRRGFRQGKVQGDPWQQGGVVVLAHDARLVHRQIDAVGGDPIDVAAVVAAVRGCAG